jgi:hypothetical protein
MNQASPPESDDRIPLFSKLFKKIPQNGEGCKRKEEKNS